jgi:hypothetical protein
MPNMRTCVQQELLWAYLNDIDLSQPFVDQLNAWEHSREGFVPNGGFYLSIVENQDRKRSASLVPYTDKEKKKAPRPDQLLGEKVQLREIYKKVAGFLMCTKFLGGEKVKIISFNF